MKFRFFTPEYSKLHTYILHISRTRRHIAFLCVCAFRSFCWLLFFAHLQTSERAVISNGSHFDEEFLAEIQTQKKTNRSTPSNVCVLRVYDYISLCVCVFIFCVCIYIEGVGWHLFGDAYKAELVCETSWRHLEKQFALQSFWTIRIKHMRIYCIQ